MFSRIGHSSVSCDDYSLLSDLELSDNLAAVAGQMDQLKMLYLKSTPTGGCRI